jgi:outer membrane protein assembly factor BamB/subtilisin family serine protease
LKNILFRLIASFCLLAQLSYAALPIQPLTAKEMAQGYRDHRIIAKPWPSHKSQAELAETQGGFSVRSKFANLGDVRILELDANDQVPDAIKRLRATGHYEYVEADVARTAHATTVVPNDPSFSQQWSLQNTGQSGGTAGADIGATTAWNIITDAPNVIVAVIDTGIRLTHTDLAGNLWASDTGTHGINATVASTASGFNNPDDDSTVGHGSHVAGIIGAVGNNGIGISGVAWKVQLMALKFLPATGSGSSGDTITCIEYAIAHHANIINASFGGPGFSNAEHDAVARARDAGIIFVASAGNESANNDAVPTYPAAFALDNIVAIAATTRNDELDTAYSNYGPGSVDLAAPGTDIYSANNASDTAYKVLQGTSMSAPHVAGALALLKAKFPNDTYRQLINRLLRSTTKLATLNGKVQSGGRLNIGQAVTSTDNRPFNDDFATRAIVAGPNVRVRSSNVGATAEAEPAHAGVTASHSLWWSWTPTDSTQAFFDTAGSSYDTVLAVYTGNSVGSLTPVASNDDNAGVTTSRLVLNVTAGTTYQIAVDGKAGATGYTFLKIGAVPPNDNFASAKALTGLNLRQSGTTSNASREAGEPNATTAAAGHTVWYKWTAPAAGTYSLAVFSKTTDSAVAIYTGSSVSNLTLVASNDNNAGSINSDALARFAALAGTTYYFQVDHSVSSPSEEGGDFILTLTDSLWEFPALDEITSSPAVGTDGTIYFGAGAGADSATDTNVYAVNSNGVQKWAFATTTTALGLVGSSPAIGADGTVYVGADDKILYALDGAAGTKKWSYLADGSIDTTPAIGADGTIYFKDTTKLYALTSAGVLKWSFTLNTTAVGGTYSSPVIGTDGTIYVGTTAGSFYALTDNGSSSAVKWSYTADGDIYTSPAVAADGTIYFGTLKGSFYALTPGASAASKKWSFTLPVFNGANSITSSPAIGADGTIYFAAYDHNLYAIKPATGDIKWTYALGDEVRASSPAVANDGTIYVGVYDGSVYAVNPDGTLQRTFPSALKIRSSPVIANNRLYFGSADAKLHAFDIGRTAVASAWPMFHQNQARIGRAVSGSAVITGQPQARNVVAGSAFSLSVTAVSSAPISYQWFKDNSPIAGATGAIYSVSSASAADAGNYTVTVTSPGGALSSNVAVVVLVTGGSGRLANLSVRANAGAGDQTLIAGFVVAGAGQKDILVRGLGPTLVSLGVPDAVPDPRLILFRSSDTPGGSATQVAVNDNWSTGLTDTFTAVGAVSLLAGSKDAALVSTVTPGGYSAQVVTDTNGIALAEIYDTNLQGGPRLINISGRAPISGGSGVLIAGFVITGAADKTVLIRGVGPKLAGFGVSGAIADPKLDLYVTVGATSTLLNSNDNWEAGDASAATLTSTFTTLGAFALDAGSKDSALLVTLHPGVYSAQVSGVGGSTGVALVEVYEVP